MLCNNLECILCPMKYKLKISRNYNKNLNKMYRKKREKIESRSFLCTWSFCLRLVSIKTRLKRLM